MSPLSYLASFVVDKWKRRRREIYHFTNWNWSQFHGFHWHCDKTCVVKDCSQTLLAII